MIIKQNRKKREENFFILKLSKLFWSKKDVENKSRKNEPSLERRTENDYVRMMKISCQEKYLKTSIIETSLNRANEECLNASNGYVEMNFRWKHMFYVNQYYL